MSSYWPTGDQQPNATRAQIEFARNWRDTPKVVFSSTIDKVDWNTRVVTGDAVAEITRLKAEDGGPMGICGATLAGAAMRAGLIDEWHVSMYPYIAGEGTRLFDDPPNHRLDLVSSTAKSNGILELQYRRHR